MPTNDGNGFSNKEILVSLDKKVDEGFKELKELIANGHGDHEKRIRALEDARARVLGITAMLVFVVPAGITLAVYHVI